MRLKSKRRGLPGRRLDRVTNAGPRVAASVAVASNATTPPRQPPPPPRVAIAGPRFRHAAMYGPRNRDHRKVYATIAAYADGGVRDPSIKEIARHVKIPPRTPVEIDTGYHILAIVRELAKQGWITVEWATRAWQRNTYTVNDPPRTEK